MFSVGFKGLNARNEVGDNILGDLHFTLLQMLKSMRSGFINMMELLGSRIVVMLLVVGVMRMMSMGHILDILFWFPGKSD
jgi:hypothetical protein